MKLNAYNYIEIWSTKSTIISLRSVRDSGHGLDKHRNNLLLRVPDSGDWGGFTLNSIEVIDLAYLTAKTGDEFALLRSKRVNILFHGEPSRCQFNDELVDMLDEGRLELVAHSHPAEDNPIPSRADRLFLNRIRQKSSKIISATTGRIVSYTENEFDDLGSI